MTHKTNKYTDCSSAWRTTTVRSIQNTVKNL